MKPVCRMLDVVIQKHPAVLDSGLGQFPRRTLHRLLLLLPLKDITCAPPLFLSARVQLRR